jgi:hypothetical protein
LADCRSSAPAGVPGFTSAGTSITLSLQMTDGSEALRIFNPGLADVGITSAIGIEQLDATGQWHALGTALVAGTQACSMGAAPVTHLPARAVIDVRPCLSAPHYGAGTFRYVVTLQPSGLGVIGPSFRQPA